MAQAVATAPTASDAATAPARRRSPDVPTVLLLAAVLLALLPIIVSAARVLAHDWVPVGDNGIVYARTTDVLSTDTPLLYMWSAGSDWADQDFNNPGPSLYWIFALPAAVLGPAGMVVATALLNGAAIVGLALVGRRRGGPLVGIAAVAAAAALSWTMGSSMLSDPWPPNGLLLPTLLFLALVWSVAAGDLPALPFVAGIGSLLLQTNLSYALLAPGLALFAVVALGLHLRGERRRDPGAWSRQRSRVRRVAWATAAVVAVLWTPPVVEQLTAEGDGNLTRIAQGLGQVPIMMGPRRALRLLVGVASLPSWLARSSFVDVYADPPSTAVAVVVAAGTVAVLATLAWVAARHRDRVAVAGIATAAGALLLAFATTTRSPVDGFGELSSYRTRYLWAVITFTTLVVVVAVARCFLRGRGPRLLAMGALLGMTAVLAAANLPFHVTPGGTHEPVGGIGLVRELRGQLSDLDPQQSVLFDWRAGSRNYPFWAYATIAELARRDVPFVVQDEHLVRTLGEHRRFSGDGDADLLMTVRTGDDAYNTPPRARRVALREGLTPADHRELDTLREDVVDAIDEGAVRLTPEGTRVLTRLDGDGATRRSGAGRELVEGGHVKALLSQRFLVLDGPWRARVPRYVGLEDRSDDDTVAVFVRPL